MAAVTANSHGHGWPSQSRDPRQQHGSRVVTTLNGRQDSEAHEDLAPAGAAAEGLTARAVILAILALWGSVLWMRHAGLVSHGAQLGESVPVVPAVGVLFALSLLAPVLRRIWGGLSLSRGQILFIYCFLCIAVTMSSVGVARMLFPSITALQYFESPENDFAQFQKYQPDWLVPSDPRVVQEMYEASPTETVPWAAWAKPLFFWSLFFLVWFLAMLGTITLFRRQWADRERLTFPIVHLAMDISDQGTGRLVGAFFANPIMWAGFAVAAIYNIGNILNAWNPGVPALGKVYDIGGLFTERPLSAIRPLSIAWRPENIGLGYLVSTEITLSVWVFYLLLRISNVIATGAGYEIAGFPFDQEQATGSYLALGIFLIWVARDHLRQALRKAWDATVELDDSGEPMPYRWAVIWAVVGVAGMLLFATQAGMALWTAALYFGLVLLFALVYARARAEAGAAMVWLFPFYQHKRALLYVLGSEPFARGGNWGNLTILSTMMFCSRGYFQSVMAYQIESQKIATEARLKQRAMSTWLTWGLILGMLFAYYIHLTAYYTHGANILEGGTTQGGYRTTLARQEFETLASYLKGHTPPDRARTGALVSGFVVTGILVVLRSIFLRFPLHPLGFAMVASYGGPLWGPFLLVWIVKTLVLKLGGMRMYRQLIPFFLGIVIGHFFVAGFVWGWLSLVNEMYRRYVVHFG